MPGEKMTKAMECALIFLDDKMWASSSQVGRAVYEAGHARGSNISAIGGAVLGRLRRDGLAHYLSAYGWRISPAGRQAIAHRSTK